MNNGVQRGFNSYPPPFYQFKIKIKTNIMPITESVMLFYRKVFPVFLSVCELCCNLATLDPVQ